MRRTSRQPLPRLAVRQKRQRVAPAQRVRASEQLQRRRARMHERPCSSACQPIALVSGRNVNTAHAPHACVRLQRRRA